MILEGGIEANTQWTKLWISDREVIGLYHALGECEQFHSEIKTDMDPDRLAHKKEFLAFLTVIGSQKPSKYIKLLPFEGSLLKVSKSNYGLALSNNQLHRFRYRSSKTYATAQKKFYVLRLTNSSIAFSAHCFTIYHRHHCTKKRRHNRRRDNCCRVCTPVLTAVGYNIYWYQLQ